MKLRAYAMHVYTYLDGVHDVAALTDLVRVCDDLGMRETTTRPFVRAGGPYPRRLFEAPGDGGIYQAIEHTTARLSAFLVCLAPADGPATWRDLDAEWRAVGPAATADCIGRVRLYYALYEGIAAVERLAGAVRAALPDPAALGRSATLFAGCHLWEVGTGGDDHRRDRTFVLLAPEDQEQRSDEWVWPSGSGALRPLPRYLWEMAKVRHEARRFVERRSLSWATELTDRASRFETAERTGAAPTEVRDRELRTLQRYTALAAAGDAVLRTMRRTVQAAAENAQATLDSAGHPADADGGPFEDDRSYAAWLVTEITDEADSAGDAVRYAEPMARLASAEAQQRLQDLGERGQVLTVLQTATIAAIGLVLAATQAIGYQWRTYASVQTPFVVWVLFLGLFLPLVTAARPSGRHVRRWRVRIAVSGAGFAASTACLAVAWLTRWRTGSPAASATFIATAVLAVVVAALPVGLVTARSAARRRRTRRSQAQQSERRSGDDGYDADQDGRGAARAVHRSTGGHHPVRQRGHLDDRARRRAVPAPGADAAAAGGPGNVAAADGVADL